MQRFIEWYVRLTYERCEQVLAPSRYMCDYLHSIGVMHARQQPLGVDVDTFSPERRSARPARRAQPAARHARCCCSPAASPRRRTSRCCSEAFRLLGDPWHLLLIGGELAGREGNVTRIPYCRDNRVLASYFCAADAFVHAGMHETFGLVMLEAMACGRPVVAMRAGAIPEFVDERAGVPRRAARGSGPPRGNLADAIAGLYERDLEALGAAARRHVVPNYSWIARAAVAHGALPGRGEPRRLPADAAALARAEPMHN